MLKNLKIFDYFHLTNPQAIYSTICKLRYPNRQLPPVYQFEAIQFLNDIKTFLKKQGTLLGINQLSTILRVILKYL